MIIRTLGFPNIELWSGGVAILFVCIIRYDLFVSLMFQYVSFMYFDYGFWLI